MVWLFAKRPVAVVRLGYRGGTLGRIRALQDYQRSVRPKTTWHRCGSFVGNTWGDRNRDARIGEAFIVKEIEAGARLGVDVIQIDDGWQAGMMANAAGAQATRSGLWSGYWDSDAGFWDVHPERFPNGFAPIIKAARENGVEIGLWFSPDSASDFANWERDVARILELHRRYGVRFFKMDGIRCESAFGLERLRRLFDSVLHASNGEVIFDLDITAQTRPGYWGMISGGPLFVENRYTDWHGYWPHHTLRNLWKLARWVDPLRLRFELLNNERNRYRYPDDPLAPETYAAETLFAMVMISNPLGWFECSSLPETYYQALPELVALWKRRRVAWTDLTILPVGEEPDGWSISGFLLVDPEDRLAEALFFRGAGARENERVELPAGVPRPGDASLLAGNGFVSSGDRCIDVSLPEKHSFAWLEFPDGRRSYGT